MDNPEPYVAKDGEKSDLFAALRKRHACRSFDTSRLIPDDVLQKLIYAAHRAPTGGGAPYRFLVIVKDPVQLRLLKLLSPGLFGNPPVVFIICSKTLLENEPLPKMDLEECTHFDAGAAAENVVLAAYSLGLGACFVKSYSEAGVRRLLDLPPDTRTELMVSLGYPAQNEQRPQRKGKIDKLTYVDRYGTMFHND